jgi:hypothetical protein
LLLLILISCQGEIKTSSKRVSLKPEHRLVTGGSSAVYLRRGGICAPEPSHTT